MKINEKVFLTQIKKPSKHLKQWEILKRYLSKTDYIHYAYRGPKNESHGVGA